MSCKILPIFSTPLIVLKFSKHSNYKFPNIPKTVRKPLDWKKELNTSFPNIEDDDPLVNNIDLYKFKNDLLNDINEAVSNILKKDINLKYENFWYNAYHDNQGQEQHWHMNSIGKASKIFFSGIYFNKNSNLCKTVFHREDGFHKLYNFDFFKNTHLEPFFFSTFYTYVEDGDVVLFPPYLIHEVIPNENEENKMRLTFSFNLLYEQDILLTF